ncbi:MAG: hypothetical protein FWH36_00375 [Lentimicrobiaceae bacterium]|nr:hypothetical protein [Lentimicrobiaceae bacterium]
METKINVKKSLFDIVFSISAFVVLIALYWLLSVKVDEIRASNGDSTSGDNSTLMYVIILGAVLALSLLVNIVIQTFFNNICVKNKTKSYVFFAALTINIIVIYAMLFTSGGIGIDPISLGFIFISLGLIFIKYLIARYYYKLLNKKFIDNSKINH